MSLPYYSMYPKDFDADKHVRAMEDCEIGLYIRCLNHAWINDGLPADPEEIRRLFRDNPKDFTKKWGRVEPCFPVTEDGLRRNPRQEKERREATERHAAAVAKGKLGASKRHGSAIAQLEPNHAPANSNQNQNQNQTTHYVSSAREGVPPKDDPLETVAHWLKQFGEHVGVEIKPDIAMVSRICRKMFDCGKNLDDVEKILLEMVRKKQKPKGVGWLITVIEGQLGGEYAA